MNAWGKGRGIFRKVSSARDVMYKLLFSDPRHPHHRVTLKLLATALASDTAKRSGFCSRVLDALLAKAFLRRSELSRASPDRASRASQRASQASSGSSPSSEWRNEESARSGGGGGGAPGSFELGDVQHPDSEVYEVDRAQIEPER